MVCLISLHPFLQYTDIGNSPWSLGQLRVVRLNDLRYNPAKTDHHHTTRSSAKKEPSDSTAQDDVSRVKLFTHHSQGVGTYQLEDDAAFLLVRYFQVKKDPAAIYSPVFSTGYVGHERLMHT